MSNPKEYQILPGTQQSLEGLIIGEVQHVDIHEPINLTDLPLVQAAILRALLVSFPTTDFLVVGKFDTPSSDPSASQGLGVFRVTTKN